MGGIRNGQKGKWGGGTAGTRATTCFAGACSRLQGLTLAWCACRRESEPGGRPQSPPLQTSTLRSPSRGSKVHQEIPKHFLVRGLFASTRYQVALFPSLPLSYRRVSLTLTLTLHSRVGPVGSVAWDGLLHNPFGTESAFFRDKLVANGVNGVG